MKLYQQKKKLDSFFFRQDKEIRVHIHQPFSRPFFVLFLAYLSYCDHSPSVGVHRPSVGASSVRPFIVRSHLIVYTLASTNINQSAPNLGKIYITIRSRMSSIMGLIGPEYPELFALELEKLQYFTLFTL